MKVHTCTYLVLPVNIDDDVTVCDECATDDVTLPEQRIADDVDGDGRTVNSLVVEVGRR